ncbi:SAM-dependent methyltransferase [Lentilactobacillus curieae]|uniref:SAM-dependent methyltransferase n=1 Tax=Lentilactobacillus curieae TaxID=1138822 RepID=A0A1S6QK39_9LACO|nr:class I SAM-dependent methyltransferase [Lentilactobacillus curieae]AQW21959.1 SAM-dependent methyltransferase [Lentilactobacillus curieae]
MIYEKFAKFYDELFDDDLYTDWGNYFAERVDKSASVMDLACGTGKLAIELIRQGYNVVGSDISEDMLKLASEHAQTANVNLPLVQMDMLAMDGLPNFDAISCFDDSLCYLTEDGQLEQAFSEVNAHLTAGGVFLFDVITPYQTDKVYPGYMFNDRTDDSAFMWSSYSTDDSEHAIEHDLVFFLYNEDKEAYEAYNEVHDERSFSLAEYQQKLNDAGFTAVKVTTNFGKEPYQENVKRWFFECKKG